MHTNSDTNKIGKLVGLEIANYQKTVLLTSALILALEKTKEELINPLTTNIDIDKKHIQVKTIHDTMGVKDLANSKIKEYFETVNCAVENIGIQPERKKLFQSYINQLIARQY